MIRKSFIHNKILQIYRSMESIVFPMDACKIIDTMPNCKIMTYKQFADMHKCSVENVMSLCQSKSGCTHYDIKNDRYLILWNGDGSEYNVPGRQLWTKAHELGHIVLKHFSVQSDNLKLAGRGTFSPSSAKYEAEADEFAGTLLCPMPLFEPLKIETPTDIMHVFGLSVKAANYRWDEYLRWKKTRRKTAWENDIRNIVMQKRKEGKFKACPLRAANSEWWRGALIVWQDEDEVI